jgi:acyl-CoA thioesterase
MSQSPLTPDFVQKLTAHPFAELLGMEVVDVAPGVACVRMTVREDMLNAMGTPHGGAVFALADTALAVASNSHGPMAVALDVSITYCRPAPVGAVLTARAVEENLSRNTGLYNITVTSDNGKLIAVARGTVFRRHSEDDSTERRKP